MIYTNVSTTWKVDGATPMYWFIMTPYETTFWELRHLLSQTLGTVAFSGISVDDFGIYHESIDDYQHSYSKSVTQNTFLKETPPLDPSAEY